MSRNNLKEIDICSRLLSITLKKMKDDPTTNPNVDLMWRRGHAYLRESVDTTTRPWGPIKNKEMYQKAINDFQAAHRIMYHRSVFRM